MRRRCDSYPKHQGGEDLSQQSGSVLLVSHLSSLRLQRGSSCDRTLKLDGPQDAGARLPSARLPRNRLRQSPA